MRETCVRSLGREDPLEKEMATHSSILAWKIPWTEEQVGYSPQGRKGLDTTELLHFLSRDSKRCLMSMSIPAHIYLRLTSVSSNQTWGDFSYSSYRKIEPDKSCPQALPKFQLMSKMLLF